jgi:hypothetical protein
VSLFLAILLGTSLAASPGFAAEPPIGEWVMPYGPANVRIENCGGALWGVVSGVLEPPRLWVPIDPALRLPSALGIPVMLGMRQKEAIRSGAKVTLWEGPIHNPKTGKAYEGHISLLTRTIMKVEACEAGGVFCDDQRWERVHEPSTAATTTGAGRSAAAPKSPTIKSVISADEVCSRASAAGRLP